MTRPERESRQLCMAFAIDVEDLDNSSALIPGTLEINASGALLFQVVFSQSIIQWTFHWGQQSTDATWKPHASFLYPDKAM